MPKHLLTPGEPAPWFIGHGPMESEIHFHSVAGRYIIVCIFGSAGNAAARRILADVPDCRPRFDDVNCCFFGVSSDRDDRTLSRVQNLVPGIRFFWDFDADIARQFGVDATSPTGRASFVLDERLRVADVVPIGGDVAAHVPRLLAALDALPPLAPPTAATVQAPVLVVPRLFDRTCVAR
jgi:peroxiredoxin